MSFVFLNAALAGFLVLTAVPPLLHLFARSKPPVYEFSSVEFLHRITRRTIRIRRPREWLLLAIRTAFFLTLILVFLRPLFFPQKKLAGLFQKKNVVLVVDATASMGCVEGAQT